MGKHSKKYSKKYLAITAAFLITALIPGIANAEPDWDKLAQCESGGNWAINTGNGYAGGIQFAPGTWKAYKPAGAPSSAHLASKSQQIEAGRKVLVAQGPGAWPFCSAKTGWYKGGGKVPALPPVGGKTTSYTVKPGDELAKITPNWRSVQTRSGNPALIYPGETLQIPS